jgi:anti-sigma factor RsiW
MSGRRYMWHKGEYIVTETCVDPREIKAGDLMAYVDGTADEAVVEHVRRCPACARQAEELAALQAVLAAELYRRSCPTPDQLIAYWRGELRGSEEWTVAGHLRQCPHCAREMAALARQERAGMDPVKRPRAPIEVREATAVTSQMQATEVHGAPGVARPIPQVYRACETEIIITPRPSPAHPGRWDLCGLVHIGGRVPEAISPSTNPGARAVGSGRRGATAELYRGEGLIAITSISPRGQFTFTALEPAEYRIDLAWGNREVRLKGAQIE